MEEEKTNYSIHIIYKIPSYYEKENVDNDFELHEDLKGNKLNDIETSKQHFDYLVQREERLYKEKKSGEGRYQLIELKHHKKVIKKWSVVKFIHKERLNGNKLSI